MRTITVIALVVLLAVRASAAYAHGVVGDYVFLEPLITEDPTPANELDILQPSWVKSSDANDYSIGFSGEKVLWIDDNDMPQSQSRRRYGVASRIAVRGSEPRRR